MVTSRCFFRNQHTSMRNILSMPPTARHKLNSTHVIGSLVIASAVGLLTHSPTLFVLTAGTLIALSINSGEIRLKGRR